MHCLEKYDIIGQDYLSLARSAEVQGQRNLERERKRETEQQYREEEKKNNKERKKNKRNSLCNDEQLCVTCEASR